MSTRTPGVQTRNQYGRDWGNYASLTDCPNGTTAPVADPAANTLEVGDTAYITGSGRAYCTSPGAPLANNATWALTGAGGGLQQAYDSGATVTQDATGDIVILDGTSITSYMMTLHSTGSTNIGGLSIFKQPTGLQGGFAASIQSGADSGDPSLYVNHAGGVAGSNAIFASNSGPAFTVEVQAAAATAIRAFTNGGVVCVIAESAANASAIAPVLSVANTGSGPGSVGIGAELLLKASDNAATSSDAGSIAGVLTNVTAGAQNGEVQVYAVAAGAKVLSATFNDTGIVYNDALAPAPAIPLGATNVQAAIDALKNPSNYIPSGNAFPPGTWATSDPASMSEAIDRMAALLVVLNAGPIP